MKEPIVIFELPEITDIESDKPIVMFKQKKEMPCKCILFEEKEGKCKLSVDLSKLKKKDNGTWEFEFELKDD